MKFKISKTIEIPLPEIEISAIRALGPGGQHVNRSSTSVHIRFNIISSSLPKYHKERLLSMHDHRISKDGVIVIKSQEQRSQKRNKEVAFERLKELILHAGERQKKRRPTLPTKSSQKKRVDKKTKHGKLKQLRAKVAKNYD